MIDILDILAIPTILILMGVLTIPVIKILHTKPRYFRELLIGWFLIGFALCVIAIANLSFKYFNLEPIVPFFNINIAGSQFLVFSSSFLVDALSVYIVVIFIIIGTIAVIYGVLSEKDRGQITERYYAVMLIVLAGLIGAALAGDLLTLFIFWEVSAAGSSFLMLYRKTPRSIHATLKYLVMIVIGSSFIMYGLSIVFSIAGTLNFWEVRNVLIIFNDKTLLLVAFGFIAGGYAIEAAIVPFHLWLPDAYTEAPASSSAFLSGLVDQGSYYVLLRVLIYILTPTVVVNWTTTIAVFAALSMIVGNLRALTEVNIKRLVAYICVADVGYNLVAISSMTPVGVMANLFFFLVGGMATALAFMTVGLLNNMGIETLDDFNGIGRSVPWTSLGLSFGLLSFTGIPPFAGFFAKYLVFTSAIEGDLAWLAVIGVTASVIQAAYIFRLVNRMYGRPSSQQFTVKESRAVLIPIFILGLALIVLGFFPTLALNLIQPVVQELPMIP